MLLIINEVCEQSNAKMTRIKGLMDKVSASQPCDREFELHTGHEHDSSYDTITGGSREQTRE